MLEAVLAHLNNWFPERDGRRAGTYEIRNGALAAPFLREGQYFRVRGSAFNDGLHRQGGEALRDEKFTGEVWALAIPPGVIALAQEIAAWREANPESDRVSESFGGYSYTRGDGSSGFAGGWQAAFAARLSPYRRAYDD